MAELSDAKKREIRAEMARRLRKKMRQKGAAKTIGGTAGAALAGGTGSLKGGGYSADEKLYAQTIRKKQKGTPAKKEIARTSRARGKTSPVAITRQKMKTTGKGGTVGKGTHATGTKLQEAKDWQSRRLTAVGTDQNKINKIKNRYKRMTGTS